MKLSDAKSLDKHLEIINEILPNASPIGAYCTGMLTSFALQRGLWPDLQTIRHASQCETLDEGKLILEMLESVTSERKTSVD